MPSKLNIKIYQGSTFSQVLRWESNTKVYVPITAITKAAPMVVTAPAHNIPVGWRTKISGVQGMKEANADHSVVTSTTTDTITFNAVNSLAYGNYTSGGILEYNKPIDLTNIIGRMQLREKTNSPNFLLELTSANGLIQVNNMLKTITFSIPATITENLKFTSAVYSLELVNGTTVVPFVYGNVSLVTEVTR
jgi:hypothetical protein